MRKKFRCRLWDFLFTWIYEANNLSISSSKYANGRSAIEIITDETLDIGKYLDFGFYEWVIFKANASLGIPFSCATVQPLMEVEMQVVDYKPRMTIYDASITECFNIKNPFSITHLVCLTVIVSL